MSILSVAQSQIGVKESPSGSNNVKYGAWYGMNGQPWCDMFVSWCAAQAGVSNVVGKFAYCPSHVNYFKQHGWWHGAEYKPQPGDIIFFGRHGVACHVGIVERRNGTQSVTTIEGNTSVSSNDNGGSVMRRTRTYGNPNGSWGILGFAHPPYANAAPVVTDKTAPTGNKPFSDRPICNEQHFGIWVTNVKDQGGSGIAWVKCAVWSVAKGQDDIVWYDMGHVGNNPNTTYALSVDANRHGGVRDGNVIVGHVYVRDKAGNQRCLGQATTEMTTKISTPLGNVGNCYYRAHVQGYGWMPAVGEGQTAGTTGQRLRLEALAVKSNIEGVHVKAQGHVQGYGWMGTFGEDQAIGTVTQSLRLEAVRLTLTGENADKYDIMYRAHVQDVGWQPWVKNGAIAGTTGQSLRMEAIQIMIKKKK